MFGALREAQSGIEDETVGVDAGGDCRIDLREQFAADFADDVAVGIGLPGAVGEVLGPVRPVGAGSTVGGGKGSAG